MFDNPGQQPHTPNSFEQSRRDAAQDLPVDHQNVQFRDDSKTPVKWREFLTKSGGLRRKCLYSLHTCPVELTPRVHCGRVF